MKKEEKKLLSAVSFSLRMGVFLFIILGAISYLPLRYSSFIMDLGIFFLILTPLLRIIILCIGLWHIGDRRYSVYAFLVFVIIISGFLFKSG